MDAARLGRTEAWLALAGFAVLMAVKVLIAGHLDPFWDEAYYWQAAQRPALAYVDKPFMTAFLIKLGVAVAGDTKLGIRLAYLAIGAAFPFVVYWAARPLVERGDAWRAAGLSLLLPMTAWIGLFAFQDAPLLLFTLIGLGALIRARRTDRTAWWLLLGVAGAAGFATHYRFVFFPLAVAVYLAASRRGRDLLRRPGPWLAAGVAAVGLLPILVFNLQNDFASLSFQLVERNPWRFDPKGLRQPLEQALAVSPLFYVIFIAVLVDALRRARQDDDAALVGIVAGVQLGAFLVLGPFADMEHFHIHWPLAGYLPLLLLAPAALRRFVAAGPAGGRRWRRGLVVAAPVTAALMVASGLMYLLAATLPDRLLPDLVVKRFEHGLLAWSRLGSAVSARLSDFDEPSAVALVGGHYRIASELDFALRPARPVYVLDHRRNSRDGYKVQYELWGLDEAGLRAAEPGSDALIVVQDEDYWYYSAAHVTWLAGLCSLFADLRPLGSYELPSAKLAVRFYAGMVRPTPSGAPDRFGPGNCAALPAAFLPRPKRGQRIAGPVDVFGWVLDAAGVAAVEIVVDGAVVAGTVYGTGYEPPIRRRMPGAVGPDLPKVGFRGTWDPVGVTAGRHQLGIRVTTVDGRVWQHGERTIFVEGVDSDRAD